MNLGKESSEEIVIRRINRSEFEQVFKLLSSAFQNEIDIAGLDARRFKRMARFYSLVSGFLSLLDTLHIDFETILVAVSNGKVLGGVHLVPHGKQLWSIDSVAVDMQFRRRGIYKRLMKNALRYVAERRGERVIQTIRIGNVAPMKVAKELGFEVSENKTLLHLKIGYIPRQISKENVVIRDFKKTDVEKVRKICVEASLKKIETRNIEPQDFRRGLSLSTRVRNRISQVHSKKLVLIREGDIVGYASVTYTSPEEAGNIDSFCILPSKEFPELAGFLVSGVLDSLGTKNINKLIVSLPEESLELSEVFERFGFRHVAFFCETTKNLISRPHQVLT